MAHAGIVWVRAQYICFCADKHSTQHECAQDCRYICRSTSHSCCFACNSKQDSPQTGSQGIHACSNTPLPCLVLQVFELLNLLCRRLSQEMKLYHADVLQTSFLATLSDRLLSEAKSGVGEGLLFSLGMKIVPHHETCFCNGFCVSTSSSALCSHGPDRTQQGSLTCKEVADLQGCLLYGKGTCLSLWDHLLQRRSSATPRRVCSLVRPGLGSKEQRLLQGWLIILSKQRIWP